MKKLIGENESEKNMVASDETRKLNVARLYQFLPKQMFGVTLKKIV
jgi:hypothetical protein